MSVLSLLAASSLGAILAVLVRLRLSWRRGYDFAIPAVIAVCSEAFFWGQERSLTLGLGLALASSFVAWFVWEVLLQRFPSMEGGALLTASLGLSLVITGTIGMVRGGGVRMTSVESSVSIDGLFIAASCVFLLGVAAFSRSTPGVALELYAQDVGFATELGVNPATFQLAGILTCAVSAAFVGAYVAVSFGSTPEGLGVPFLLGIVGALLPRRPHPALAAVAGAACGALWYATQVLVSPSVALAVVMLALLLLLVRRIPEADRKFAR